MVGLQAADFELRTVETARRHLDDIDHCAAADYRVRWFDDGCGRSIPSLIVAFNLEQTRHQPACAVSLAAVSRSTGTWSLLDGERLRGHVRRSIEDYLTRCGVLLKPGVLPASDVLAFALN